MARPCDRTANRISVLGSGTPVEPFADSSPNLGLARLWELSFQLLPQHRFTELEESQGRFEAFGNQLLPCGHGPSLPLLPRAYNHPLCRAIRAASTRFSAPSLLIASER